MYLKAFILAIIEAITEFLPISSTAHLLVAGELLGFDNFDGHLFEVAIQFGAILAVLVLYFSKIRNAASSLKNKESQAFFIKFLVAFLPIAGFGFILHNYAKSFFSSEYVIAFSLIFGGIIILIVDRIKIKQKFNNMDEVDNVSAMKIGLYQVLSLIPGMSRSGTTIIGGLLTGLSQKTAVEFSFILAIPTIFAATVYDIYKNYNLLDTDNVGIIIFGFIVSFLASLFAVKKFLDYISNHNLDVFGWYRIVFGFLIFSSQFFK